MMGNLLIYLSFGDQHNNLQFPFSEYVPWDFNALLSLLIVRILRLGHDISILMDHQPSHNLAVKRFGVRFSQSLAATIPGIIRENQKRLVVYFEFQEGTTKEGLPLWF
jgi:hypothetical protein